MPNHPRSAAAILAAGLLVGALAACEPDPGSGPTSPTPAPTSQFVPSWTKPVTNQKNISTSSPVVVGNGGNPFVVTGDLGGNLKAFRLSDGSPVSGWSNVNAGFEIKAPLSTDGSNVYVPVARDGINGVPQFKKYNASGSLLWNTNTSATTPQAGRDFLLAGMSLAQVGGQWKAYGASSGHWVYGFDGATGAKDWEFRNADSTMATPALADLYGTGAPNIITSNDKSAETSTDRNGGHLRIFSSAGQQVCSADQTVTGNTHASSGYNNSSPVVTEMGGRPLIVFGSTGPTQTGAGGNQVVAYDANCKLRWASKALPGQALASPTLADVMGTGEPQVIQVIPQLDGSKKYPRVYVLDANNGQVLSDTGATLRTYGNANLAYTSATSIATADLNGDGREELFVPASSLLVLDGRTRTVMQAISLNGSVMQNTPIVTAEPGGGVRVTVAGYSGNNGNGVYGGIVRSYVAATGTLGEHGWPQFGHDPQLTGRSGEMNGPYDTIVEGQTLASGGVLTAGGGAFAATMGTDGNFAIANSQGTTVWSTGTSVPGSTLRLGTTGTLQVKAPNGSVLWQSTGTGNGYERLVLGNDGIIRAISGSYTGAERTNVDTVLWQSSGTAPSGGDQLTPGNSLRYRESLESANGTYRLSMQSDGNLVLYNGNRAIYQSGTHDTSGSVKLSFQRDGNLVIYGAGGSVLKNYAINGRGGVLFKVQNDGVLRVSTATDKTVYATNTKGK